MDKGEYFSAHTDDLLERERLTALEAAIDPNSLRHLDDLGLGPGWQCLEVGGGGGSVARWMGRKVGPQGRVVATDVDTRFLRQIDEPNIEVRKLDVLQDELEDSVFDLVHCRFLLIHLPDPELAVRRMTAAARIGGWVLVEEPDFSTYRAVDPNHPLSESFSRKVREIFDEIARIELFDPCLGPGLRSILERAGLSEVGSEGAARVWRGGEAEAREHSLSLPALVRAGVCSQADALELEKALADREFTFVGHTVFSAWGKRTA